MTEKKNTLTREGLIKYEKELHELKSVRRAEIAQKIKEARDQGDISENAEYAAARDEQADNEARISELEKILDNVEVIDIDQNAMLSSVVFGCRVRVEDIALAEESTYTIKGSNEANVLEGVISNVCPLGKALIGAKKGDVISVEAPDGLIQYRVLDLWMESGQDAEA